MKQGARWCLPDFLSARGDGQRVCMLQSLKNRTSAQACHSLVAQLSAHSPAPASAMTSVSSSSREAAWRAPLHQKLGYGDVVALSLARFDPHLLSPHQARAQVLMCTAESLPGLPWRAAAGLPVLSRQPTVNWPRAAWLRPPLLPPPPAAARLATTVATADAPSHSPPHHLQTTSRHSTMSSDPMVGQDAGALCQLSQQPRALLFPVCARCQPCSTCLAPPDDRASHPRAAPTHHKQAPRRW